jgi:hypothetical protein
MHLVSGGWQDNVVRQREFETRHPDISIKSDQHSCNWYASRDGVVFTSDISLGSLLNKLEFLTGERD